MNDEVYHAFYSQSHHNNPTRLIIYGKTIGPNPVKKEVSYFISANNSHQPLTGEELKQLLECNSHWPDDINYIGVVRLVPRTNYMMKGSLFDLAYNKIRENKNESNKHNTT